MHKNTIHTLHVHVCRILYLYFPFNREIWKCIHLRKSYFPEGIARRKYDFWEWTNFYMSLLKGKLMSYSTIHLQNVHILLVICPHLHHSYGTLCFLLLVLSCYENSVSLCMSIDACYIKSKSWLKFKCQHTKSTPKICNIWV